jgi:hypothetical protein
MLKVFSWELIFHVNQIQISRFIASVRFTHSFYPPFFVGSSKCFWNRFESLSPVMTTSRRFGTVIDHQNLNLVSYILRHVIQSPIKPGSDPVPTPVQMRLDICQHKSYTKVLPEYLFHPIYNHSRISSQRHPPISFPFLFQTIRSKENLNRRMLQNF